MPAAGERPVRRLRRQGHAADPGVPGHRDRCLHRGGAEEGLDRGVLRHGPAGRGVQLHRRRRQGNLVDRDHDLRRRSGEHAHPHQLLAAGGRGPHQRRLPGRRRREPQRRSAVPAGRRPLRRVRRQGHRSDPGVPGQRGGRLGRGVPGGRRFRLRRRLRRCRFRWRLR